MKRDSKLHNIYKKKTMRIEISVIVFVAFSFNENVKPVDPWCYQRATPFLLIMAEIPVLAPFHHKTHNKDGCRLYSQSVMKLYWIKIFVRNVWVVLFQWNYLDVLFLNFYNIFKAVLINREQARQMWYTKGAYFFFFFLLLSSLFLNSNLHLILYQNL